MDILSAVVLMTNAVFITIALYEYWKFKHGLNNLNLFLNKKMEELGQILHEQSNETSNSASKPLTKILQRLKHMFQTD